MVEIYQVIRRSGVIESKTKWQHKGTVVCYQLEHGFLYTKNYRIMPYNIQSTS